MITFDLKGMPELERDLKALHFHDQQIVLNRAARAGAKIIQQRAAELAPRGATGKLSREMIVTGAGQGNDISRVTLLIGPSIKAFYGLFQEVGTAYAAAQPFLAPAFRQMEADTLSAIASELNKQIQKVVNRNG